MEETWAQTTFVKAAAKWNFVVTPIMLRILRRRYPNAKIDFGNKQHEILKKRCAEKANLSTGEFHGTNHKTNLKKKHMQQPKQRKKGILVGEVV